MNFKRLLLYILFAVMALPGFANGVILKASLDSTEIVVGDQVRLRVELRMPELVKVEPVTKFDSLVNGVELVEARKADTVRRYGTFVITQDFMLTSFDSGYYEIPPLKYMVNGETIYSSPLKFSVYNYEIGVEPKEGQVMIMDIKDVYKPPFDWFGLIPFLIIFHLFVVVVALLLFLYFKFVKNRNGLAAEGADKAEEVDDRTIDQIALDELNKMKAARLWAQPDMEKAYFTQLTDILREYLGCRFDVRAKEMTSYEMIDALKYEIEMSPVLSDFKAICQMSDMVKFAKQKPSAEECEMCLVKSFFIVSQTAKKAETPVLKKEAEKRRPEDNSDFMPKTKENDYN